MATNEKYRVTIDHLSYISTNTRSDISAAVCILSQKVSKPTTSDSNQDQVKESSQEIN